jgi:hypothetical protein
MVSTSPSADGVETEEVNEHLTTIIANRGHASDLDERVRHV